MVVDIQSNTKLAQLLILCGISHLAGMNYERKKGIGNLKVSSYNL